MNLDQTVEIHDNNLEWKDIKPPAANWHKQQIIESLQKTIRKVIK
jgi:hypothetical protein